MTVRDKSKEKRREELEKLLEYCPESVEYEEEGDGVLSKKITPIHTYKLMKAIGHRQQVQGQFLLYLDDRITDQNGYHGAILSLQEQVTKICNDRDQTCPVAPLVREIEEIVVSHLETTKDEKLITETEMKLREQWKLEGKNEERNRFERSAKIIALVISVVTFATGLITWFLGIWG